MTRPPHVPNGLDEGDTHLFRGAPATPYDAGRVAAAETAVAAANSHLDDVRGGGVRDCPTGMVPVGDSCVDRYEASVWDDPACDGVTGTQFGQTADDYPPGTYPDNGNVTVALYACSVAGVPPSRFATWFQAQQACVASGKRLCSNEEWQAAAAGTRDPGAWPGASGTCTSTPPAVGRCNTCSTAPRNTGQAGSVAGGADDCVSAHGAEDMIGNVTEWVAWWGQVGLHWQTGDGQQGTWPADYGSDGTWNMDGRVGHVWPWTNGLPAAANRGGFWHYGTAEGTFDFNLSVGPGYRTDLSLFGFRCCRMR